MANKQEYSTDFLIVRRAVFMNFIARNAPIREEDLTPQDIYAIIYDLGKHFASQNVAGLSAVPELNE
jgi:hypothetical protein